jgi:hypothetical protein
MRLRTTGVLCAGLVLILVACGRVNPGPTAAETPSPLGSPSPSAQPAPLSIPGPTFHLGEVGAAYSPVTISATGGNSPYLWSLGEGTLPPGLALDVDGAIAGSPTASGTFNFTVDVLDASMATASTSGAIVVAPRLTASLLNAGTITFKQGSAAVTSFASAAGGAPPYAYSLQSGALPPGTSLNGLSLTGTFNSAGTFTFTVSVGDSLGGSTAVNAAYYVWGPIAFDVPPFPGGGSSADQRWYNAWNLECDATNAAGCSVRLPYIGGTPGVVPTFYSSTENRPGYPQTPLFGFTVTVSGGAAYLSIAPNSNPNGWNGKVMVGLQDPQTSCSREGTFSPPLIALCDTSALVRIVLTP